MSDMQVSQVLAQIRALSREIRPPAAGPLAPAAAGAPGAPAAPGGLGGVGPASGGLGALGAPAAGSAGSSGVSSFATLLKAGIDQVSQAQQRAGDLADAFQRGVPGVDLPQVMIETQKATVSFRALAEVRNRLVSAYQEIMNMTM